MKSLLGLLEPEEFVGKLWHRLSIQPAPRASPRQPPLSRVRGPRSVSSFGASAGRPDSASRRPLRAPNGTFGAPRRDGQALYLPAVVDLWPERADNHALHLWLAAFFAHLPLRAAGPPAVVRDISLLATSRAATAATLAAAPGT